MKEYIFREVTPILEPEDFQQVIEHPSWKDISPNFPSSFALLPKFFTKLRINRLIEAFAHGSPLTRLDPTDMDYKPELEVDDLGKLTFIGRGESKWCYLLTAEDQKKVAVHIGGADAQFRIPSDPRIHVVSKNMGKYGLSYSDLRTYLCLPVNLNSNDYKGPISMMFQEWGGEISLDNPKDQRIKRGTERVIHYLLERGHSVHPITLQELSHPRHYLLNQGADKEPAAIDIHFESNKYP